MERGPGWPWRTGRGQTGSGCVELERLVHAQCEVILFGVVTRLTLRERAGTEVRHQAAEQRAWRAVRLELTGQALVE